MTSQKSEETSHELYTGNIVWRKFKQIDSIRHLKSSNVFVLPNKKNKNSVAFSPQANYTDQTAAACRPS
jgi:hypothetical protein